ncbi:MAG: aminotransferase class III-fold pyridoxal phosphate-dependent enzyme [Candidatus Aenigmatarchaeota archaeon]|nr:MAG: aminotransferase class III-fold pyridoxal phosphate-dependent enzyme [Candidatus Aenigmarchaeota archaeon]
MATRFVCKPPGPRAREWIKRDTRVVGPSYPREFDFVFERGRGMYLWDVDGRRHLDFAAGIAVNNIGHDNPDVVRAVKAQLRKGIHAGFLDMYARLPVEFCETLLEHMPAPLNKGRVFLSNSGTESVEAAYKMVKWTTHAPYVHSFAGAFHGRTMGALSLTNTASKVQKEGFEPFLPARHSPFCNPYRAPCGVSHDCVNGCLHLFERAIKDGQVGAVFMEPVQGEGGYVVPPREFVKGVREACNRHGVYLVSDEVQAGCYRTGRFLSIENFGVRADVACISKAIGGGVPLAATVSIPELQQWHPGAHANTFGGNLLACAAGIAALKFMRRERLGENAKRIGAYMLKRLEKMKNRYEIIGDVRGLGLMIGIELVKDRKTKEPAVDARHAVLCDATGKGLVLLPAGESTIRICPPLIITKKQADTGLDILESCFEDLRGAL